ncbi:hypothetical protein ACA910_005663 [Epithemia clementina (nom. ined.)]
MQSEVLGLVFLIFSLWCLGTWPALLRLCSFDDKNWHFSASSRQQQQEQQTSYFSNPRRRHSPLYTVGLRNICHVYMDYATAYFLVSSVPLLLAMMIGADDAANEELAELEEEEEVGFFRDAGTSPRLILVAMMGGTLLSLGNLSLQWATTIYGASLTVTLAIQASLTVLLGTFLNYALEPSQTSHPIWLVGGVFFFLLAIALAAMAQCLHSNLVSGLSRESTADRELLPEHVLKSRSTVTTESSSVAGDDSVVQHQPPQQHPHKDDGSDSSSSSGEWSIHRYHAALCGGYNKSIGECGGGDYSMSSQNSAQDSKAAEAAAAEQRQVSKSRRKLIKGLSVAIAGGMAFGFYSPAFNIAVNDPFHWSRIQDREERAIADGGLAVARTNLWFSLAFWMASMLGNVFLLHRERVRHPELYPCYDEQSVWSVVWVYVSKESLADRQLAIMAGLVCAVGNTLQFQAGKMVGYAAADLVHAYPLVSTLWDVFLFEEFNHVDLCSRLGALLLAMYVAYLTGIALLAGSSVL